MRRLLLLAVVLCFSVVTLYAQTGEITGQVTDQDSKEGVPFANVAAYQQGKLVAGSSSDFDGYYIIKPLEPGVYDVHVTIVGYPPKILSGVSVSANRISEVNIKMESGITLDVIEVQYQKPLVDKEVTASVTNIDQKQIQAMATTSIGSIVSTSAGVYQADEKSGLNIKGGRDDANEIYIDGVRVIGSSKITVGGIEEISVITGGVPAKFGDATGGIINITTRGPSKVYTGGIDVATSQGLDPFGYTRASFDLTGPIYKKNKGTKDEKSLLGFFIAGEYLRQEDSRPSAVGVFKAKDDVLRQLELNPLVPSPVAEGFIVATETVTREDLELVKTKPNVVENNYTLSGKLDVKPTETINLTFGGTWDYVRRHDWVDRYTLFNYVNNPLYNESTYRAFARFRQRFPGKAGSGEEGEGGSRNIFQNAYYQVQFDYTKVFNKFEDDSHGFSPFDYGYLGDYDVLRQPVYQFGEDEVTGKEAWLLAGYQDTLVRFKPGTVNPTGTAFPEKYYQLAGAVFEDGWYTTPFGGAQNGFYQTLDQIILNGSMRNGDRPRVPHDIWFNTGRQFNGYGISADNDQFRASLLGSVDILPKGSARNKHSIEFGFEFEQRIQRSYQVLPIDLWEIMRLLVNSHLTQLDLDNPYFLIDGVKYNYDDPNAPILGLNDTITYDRKYVEQDQAYFDKSLRRKLGLPVDGQDFVNIDMYGPEFYSLDMFSPDELLNNTSPRFSNYVGYDPYGNRLGKQPSFEDFWREKDANGNFTRAIGAFRPIYSSVYIQDKFNFKDLLFNVGVRIDRFDANQKVLRDPFTLYRSYSVGEIAGTGSYNAPNGIPANIGSDYVVYVDDANNITPTILGYRDGNRWFTADGEETNTPQLIARSSATGRITPFLVNPNENIKAETFDPNSSFQDYEPQITVMPRVAFSFNLTDEASFFAHYDILTQRPQSRLRTDPSTWYFFEENISGVINNPALKPERTIDYQLGFRQLLSQNSAVTISAFYREMRDMVQVTNMPFAYPREYRTFGNVDFGTVKGFSIGFDLRNSLDPITNLSLRFNYTIQFAEGTGSNTTSQLNLVGAGQPNLRTIVPLDFDSRHNMNLVVDYGYGEGRFYNGPKIKGKEILANAGVNLTIRARSGEPYTQQDNPTAEALRAQATRKILSGSINGSRLPWNFRVDLRVYKDFKLNGLKQRLDEDGKALPGPKRDLYLNVYLLAQNLLDTRNIIRNYPYTGNADDDGYLSSPIGQQDLGNQINPRSYEDLYMAYIGQGFDPSGALLSNYSLPRHIRLGAIFKF